MPIDIEKFAQGYRDALKFTQELEAYDFSPSTDARIDSECRTMCKLLERECPAWGHGPSTIQDTKLATSEQLGIDFWMTRNGHGVGYWENDYGTPEECDRATQLAKCFGEVDTYLNDNDDSIELA